MVVEFNEPGADARVARPAKVSGLSKLIIGTGLVKSEQGAQIIFLVLALVCIVLSAYMYATSGKESPQPTPAQVAL
jgi:hypothetical protein